MIDRSSTVLNGAGLITDLRAGSRPHGIGTAATPRDGRLTLAILILGAAVGSAVLLTVMPSSWMWESTRVLGVGVVLLFLVVWTSHFPTRRPKTAFVIWWLALVSGCIFFRAGDLTANVAAYKEQFPAAVYGEVLGWLLYLVAVLIFFAPIRGYMRGLFSGDYKWLTLFALLCVASCIYAPRVLYALGWAFKLPILVLLLLLCSTQIHDLRDTISFLRVTFWAYVLVVAMPVILGFASGLPFDEEGRMSPIVSPNALGPDAAALFVLALTLYSRAKGEGLRKSAVLVGAGALTVMILAGSKTGIVSGVVAGVLFFALRKKFGTAFGYVAIAALLLFVMILFTPLGSYFATYEQSGEAATFTGRTSLWANVMPAIRQKPILGHGYQASMFVEMQVNAVQWGASHLHNGFVEVLYNNGLLGLILIVIIIFAVPRNLIRVLRRAPSTDPVYRIAAGCLALYTLLFINGVFNASFGGKARPPFMLLFALVLVSNKLLELVPPPSQRIAYVAWKENS
jgi:exopolysaccharide production protein ExoQ